jgi:TRAP-type C4-dicarboxylate transport system permease small subunit
MKMDYFERIIQRISNICTSIGAVMLVLIMGIIVTSIILRFFGRVLPGMWELVQLFIVVTAGFALVHTGLTHDHIAVNFVLSRLTERGQDIFQCIASFVGLGIWSMLAWGTLDFIFEGWLFEKTEMIEFPYFPFKFAWAVSLFLMCTLLFIDCYHALRRLRK